MAHEAGDGTGHGVLVADIAFDNQDSAIVRRKGAVKRAIGKIEDANPPAGRKKMPCDDAADTLRSAGHQGDGLRLLHLLVALDGQIGARTPFRPGAVVKALDILAECLKRK